MILYYNNDDTRMCRPFRAKQSGQNFESDIIKCIFGIKMLQYRLKFYWCFFLRIQLTTKSVLVQATRRYLNQYWPRSLTPYVYICKWLTTSSCPISISILNMKTLMCMKDNTTLNFIDTFIFRYLQLIFSWTIISLTYWILLPSTTYLIFISPAYFAISSRRRGQIGRCLYSVVWYNPLTLTMNWQGTKSPLIYNCFLEHVYVYTNYDYVMHLGTLYLLRMVVYHTGVMHETGTQHYSNVIWGSWRQWSPAIGRFVCLFVFSAAWLTWYRKNI